MQITDLRLFHNHMTIEPVIEVFGAFNGKVSSRLRRVIFEEFVQSDCYGMIYTYMWAFESPSDWEYIRYVSELFGNAQAEVYYVELVAPQSVRLQRNATENRLQYKASKRDIDLSNQRLLAGDEAHRFESNEGEIPFENYIKIDNTHLSPEAVACIIKERFSL